MQVKHPVSFGLMLGVIVMTSALAVMWNLGHLLALVVDIGAIVGLRWLAHREGRVGPTHP
jgi:hypothetical protein